MIGLVNMMRACDGRTCKDHLWINDYSTIPCNYPRGHQGEHSATLTWYGDGDNVDDI
jgi:hypothetical protein